MQTSLYGASKLAGEGLIQAYCEGFGFQGWIFRFVSILGERYTHGHVFDFYRKLARIRPVCAVLGNGRQRKSYLYVQDCIDAIFVAHRALRRSVNIFNLGTDEYCELNDSIGWITGHLGVCADARVHRRRARLDRRQPVHLSRHDTDPGARLDAEAVDPRGVMRTLDYLQSAIPTLLETQAMNDRRPRPLAPRLGDRRVPRRRRTSGPGFDPDP